jgi:hypothetical protein
MTTLINNGQKDLPPLVRVSEVAQILSVSNPIVHRLIQRGDLNASVINPTDNRERQHLRVTRASLLKFYQKRFGHSLLRALNHSSEN